MMVMVVIMALLVPVIIRITIVIRTNMLTAMMLNRHNHNHNTHHHNDPVNTKDGNNMVIVNMVMVIMTLISMLVRHHKDDSTNRIYGTNGNCDNNDSSKYETTNTTDVAVGSGGNIDSATQKHHSNSRGATVFVE